MQWFRLVDYARGTAGNDAVLSGWVAKWVPLGDAAIDAYCAALPDDPGAGRAAKDAARAFRAALGFTV